MPKRSKDADDAIARLALSLIDLRAHFEAQLRTIAHSEQCLLSVVEPETLIRSTHASSHCEVRFESFPPTAKASGRCSNKSLPRLER